jgi:hypothetical protein
MLKYTQEDIERFYSKITIVTEGPYKGCWNIDYALDKKGYPHFSIKSYPISANRFMYMIHHQDENIDSLNVCHSCDNPWCINPDHLWLGTHQENMEDMVNKDRQSKGDNHYTSKLTGEIVKNILDGIQKGKFKTSKEIINKYQISNSCIYNILNNKWWKHITTNYNLIKLKKLLDVSTKQQFFGENSPSNKLNDFLIVEMINNVLNKKYTSVKQISNIYNLSKSSIFSILNEKTWSHVTKDYEMNTIRNLLDNHTGCNHHCSKLTKYIVIDIKNRLKNKETVSEISKFYNIERTIVNRIKLGKSYKNVV